MFSCKEVREFSIDAVLQDLDTKIDMVKSEYKVLMHHIYQLQDSRSPEVKVVEKPSKGVWALKDYGKDKLVMVPFTSNIVVYAASMKAPPNSVELATIDGTHKVYALPKASGTKTSHVVPYWYVRTTSHTDEANTMVSDNIKVCTQYTFQGQLAGNMSSEKILPILVNHKAIKKGEEVVVWRPATCSAATSSGSSSSSKRARLT